jgi:FkbM family methyltransferase
MDLHFNSAAPFTRWVVRSGTLYEPFVVVDIGVQGGENTRWHLLRDYLIVHGFDAIEEVIEELRQKNRNHPNRHYHCLAAGSTEEERSFYFNNVDPYSSSFYPRKADRFGLREQRREQERKVKVRPLDALLADGTISRADFLKCDVEGFEKEVFLGACALLNSVLGIETETNFFASPLYPDTHLCTLQRLLLDAHLLIFDLSFYRVPRASFTREVARRRAIGAAALRGIGKPAIVNVLFCRDLIDEADHQENYTSPCRPVSVDQLIKLMIIYELYGLSDVALDTAARFADRLAERLDVGQAVHLLADPFCRNRVRPIASPRRTLRQAANRALRAFRVNSRF